MLRAEDTASSPPLYAEIYRLFFYALCPVAFAIGVLQGSLYTAASGSMLAWPAVSHSC